MDAARPVGRCGPAPWSDECLDWKTQAPGRLDGAACRGHPPGLASWCALKLPRPKAGGSRVLSPPRSWALPGHVSGDTGRRCVGGIRVSGLPRRWVTASEAHGPPRGRTGPRSPPDPGGPAVQCRCRCGVLVWHPCAQLLALVWHWEPGQDPAGVQDLPPAWGLPRALPPAGSPWEGRGPACQGTCPLLTQSSIQRPAAGVHEGPLRARWAPGLGRVPVPQAPVIPGPPHTHPTCDLHLPSLPTQQGWDSPRPSLHHSPTVASLCCPCASALRPFSPRASMGVRKLSS